MGNLVAPVRGIPLQYRQRHDEGAALARDALERDASGVRLDDPLDQAEAEPGTLDLRGDDVGGAVERVEYFRLVGRRDADPAVADAHVNRAAGGHGDPDPPAAA